MLFTGISVLAKIVGIFAIIAAVYIATSTYIVYVNYNLRDYSQIGWNVFWIGLLAASAITAYAADPLMHCLSLVIACIVLLRNFYMS